MISFVILHYKNIKDTLECIQSIKKNIANNDFSIVVVDNNTLNKEEENKILNETKDLIKLPNNMGFAKGNNEGCFYAIKKYHPDFLCVLNNDTIITQKNFIKEICDSYNKTKFDILGPKIITNKGDSINPFYAYKTIKEIDEQINYSNKLIKIYSNKILFFLLKKYMFIKHLFIPIPVRENGKESCLNVSLHGCCLIFSKKYYERFKNVFYPETFLYHEEEFLDYRRRKYNLITYYDCNLEIFHKEGSSLDELFKNKNIREKLIFRNKEIIKSLSLLKQVIIEDKDI